MSNYKVTPTIISIILLGNIALSQVSAQVMAKPPVQGNTSHQASLQNQPTHKPHPTATTQPAAPGQATSATQAAPAQQAPPSAAKNTSAGNGNENANVHAPIHPDTSAGPVKHKNNGTSTTPKE